MYIHTNFLVENIFEVQGIIFPVMITFSQVGHRVPSAVISNSHKLIPKLQNPPIIS